MSEIAISLKNVSKYYKLYNAPKDRLKEALSPSGKIYHKKFYATKNLDLEIRQGEILGIVGKNGSGKSTLLKLITGVLTPDEGSIKINGKISALLELGSGFNPEFTGLQNIFFYGTILGFSKIEMDEKLDDIIAFADIGDFLYQPLKTYSSGMKSRLGFAVAVHIDPEILILDEVLSVGDVLFKRKCYTKMEEFFNSGKTIIYVSHDTNSINHLCTRAVFLLDGNIILDADPKTVTQYYEKYLFSDKQDQASLKQELNGFKKRQNNIPEVIANNTVPAEAYAEIKEKISDKDQYLSTLISTPIYFNDKIASFDKIVIYNSENIMVNSLQLNHKYKLSFNVNFHKDLKDVWFGAQFFTINGVILSGVNTKNYITNQVFSVKDKEIFQVTVEFECLLLPGVYVIRLFTRNVHCEANIKDAYMFKVQNKSWTQGGHVHLKQKIEVTKEY